MLKSSGKAGKAGDNC